MSTAGTSAAALAIGGQQPGSPTKEAFFPAQLSTSYAAGAPPVYRVRSVAGTGAFDYTFRAPHDLAGIASLALIGAPNADFAGTGEIDLTSNYGAVGEASDTHVETQSLVGLSGTADQWLAWDLSGVFTQLEAGDICGVMVDHVTGIGTAINYVGIVLRY
jgi:hypothetical protein